MMLGTCFGLARMKNGGYGVKGIKLGSVTSRQAIHESSTLQFLQRVTTFQL